jgi:hypothetical protein
MTMSRQFLTPGAVTLTVATLATVTLNASSLRSNGKSVSTPSISPMETNPSRNSRGDCGRLDASEFGLSKSLQETSSKLYVLKEVNASEINLPVTGDKARIGVFVGENGVQVELLAPNGGPVEMRVAAPQGDPATNSIFLGRTHLKTALERFSVGCDFLVWLASRP